MGGVSRGGRVGLLDYLGDRVRVLVMVRWDLLEDRAGLLVRVRLDLLGVHISTKRLKASGLVHAEIEYSVTFYHRLSDFRHCGSGSKKTAPQSCEN